MPVAASAPTTTTSTVAEGPRTAAALSFSDWLPEASPKFTWTWPHLVHQRRRLEGALAGLEDYLAHPERPRDPAKCFIFITPPRHGKSEQNTIRFAAYVLERHPWMKVLLGCHTQSLANKFSRKIRKLCRARGVPLSLDRVAVTEWETDAGGGLRAAGVAVGIAGEGAHVIIIDDPIKSRRQAESVRYRDDMWDWFRDDVWTRRDIPEQALVFVTLTTWHADDLAGRIRNDPELAARFEIIRLPALALEDDPLGRKPGEPLCEARVPLRELLSIQRLNSYSFDSLYQGDPTPRSGNMFPRGKASIVDTPPSAVVWARGWDKAGTKEERGKFSAGVKVGLGSDGYTYIADVRRGRWEASEREAEIKATAQLDGYGIPIRIEQEPGSGGKESAQGTISNLPGWQTGKESHALNKEARAQPLASQWQAGLVRLVRGPWNQKYLEELEQFPTGTFSDQVDASSIAYNYLALQNATFEQPRVRTS